MYDKNDRYKYGNNKYRYEQSSRARLPERRRVNVPAGTVVFIILLIAAISVGSVFLGMKIAESRYGLKPSAPGTDRIVNVKSTTPETSELSAASEKASKSSAVVTNETIGRVGSGFVYDNKGAIITCYHVIKGASTVKVKLSDERVYQSSDIRGDELTDIAVIMLENEDGEPIDTKNFQVNVRDSEVTNEEVLIIGQTGGYDNPTPGSSIRASITHREVSDDKDLGYSKFERKSIEVTAHKTSLYGGLSGGFISDLKGSVVGMLYAKNNAPERDSVGYAIPISKLKNVADELIQKKYVTGRAELEGIEIAQVDKASDERPEVGLYVTKISFNKIENTSLEINDYIVSVAGYEMKTEDEWIRYIKGKSANSTINLVVERAGQQKSVILTLKQRAGNDCKKHF